MREMGARCIRFGKRPSVVPTLIGTAGRFIGFLNRQAAKEADGLDSIERAIRDALAKGDASDRAYRERAHRVDGQDSPKYLLLVFC